MVENDGWLSGGSEWTDPPAEHVGRDSEAISVNEVGLFDKARQWPTPEKYDFQQGRVPTEADVEGTEDLQPGLWWRKNTKRGD